MKKKLYSSIIAIVALAFAPCNSKAQELPLTGDLIITEFMANPGSVSDTKGEWFEILNISGKTIKLNGLIIKDEGSNKNQIEADTDLLLSAGEYFLLGRSPSPEENGGIEPDHVYSNFTLGNTEDEIILCLPDGSILDQLYYNSDWKIVSGESFELNPEYSGSGFNQDKGRWNLATTPYGNGDLGSPGQANSPATGTQAISFVNQLEVYPNPSFGEFHIALKLNRKTPLEISLINLAGQEMVIYSSRYCDELDLLFNTEGLEKGVWMVRLILPKQTMVRKMIVF